VTDEESISSSQPELHAATGVAMVGLLGPKDDLEQFIVAWVKITSDAALELARVHFPEIQLIPMEEDEVQEPS
jgi:hypothetical protein